MRPNLKHECLGWGLRAPGHASTKRDTRGHLQEREDIWELVQEEHEATEVRSTEISTQSVVRKMVKRGRDSYHQTVIEERCTFPCTGFH